MKELGFLEKKVVQKMVNMDQKYGFVDILKNFWSLNFSQFGL